MVDGSTAAKQPNRSELTRFDRQPPRSLRSKVAIEPALAHLFLVNLSAKLHR
jgi:hypothetical protein